MATVWSILQALRGIGTLDRISPALLRDPRHLLALGLGAGLAPKAPGTWGTVVAIPPYLLLSQLNLFAYLGIIAGSFLVGIYLCHFTSRALGVHDHSGIVWDEIVGFWITMTAAPAGWQWIVAGFVLFRLFDIVKPWPVKMADKQMQGGFGIMFDDLLAGLYAFACLHLAHTLIAAP